MVIGENDVLLEHIPVQPDDMITLRELLTVQNPPQPDRQVQRRRKCNLLKIR